MIALENVLRDPGSAVSYVETGKMASKRSLYVAESVARPSSRIAAGGEY